MLSSVGFAPSFSEELINGGKAMFPHPKKIEEGTEISLGITFHEMEPLKTPDGVLWYSQPTDHIYVSPYIRKKKLVWGKKSLNVLVLINHSFPLMTNELNYDKFMSI